MILYGYGFENQQKEEDILSDILSDCRQTPDENRVCLQFFFGLYKYGR
jgi:hypothetical protein